jgi:hypothetical protein
MKTHRSLSTIKAIFAILLTYLGASPRCFSQQEWESKNGKIISGNFVKIEDDRIVIYSANKLYKIKFDNLSAASQAKARDLEQDISQKILKLQDGAVIKEADFKQLLAHSPQKLNEMRLFVVGYVDSVTNLTGDSKLSKPLPKNQIRIILSGGSSAILDFSEELDKYKSKTFRRTSWIDIDGNTARLKTKSNFMGTSDGSKVVDTLVQPNQSFVFTPTVKNGEADFGHPIELDANKQIDANRLAQLRALHVQVADHAKHAIAVQEMDHKGKLEQQRIELEMKHQAEKMHDEAQRQHEKMQIEMERQNERLQIESQRQIDQLHNQSQGEFR